MAISIPPDAAGKLPPQNEEAETSVLGAILLSEQALDGLMIDIRLRPDDFYRERHRLIFKAMLRLKDKTEPEPIDALTVSEELARGGVLEEAGGSAYVHSLPNLVPAAGNVRHYARIVKEHALMRRLLDEARKIQDDVFSFQGEPAELIEQAESALFRIAHEDRTGELRSIEDVLHDELDKLELIAREGIAVTGTPSGFTDIDEITGGFQPGNLIIIAARPSMGKCSAGSTLIPDPLTGNRHRLDEVVRRHERGEDVWVAALGADLKLRRAKVSNAVRSGVQEVFRLKTRLGRTVDLTANHPLLAFDGWRELRDLHVGDRIAAPRVLPQPEESQPIGDHELVLLAALIAGGNLTNRTPRFCYGPDSPVLDEVLEAAEQIGVGVHHDGRGTATFSNGPGARTNPVTELCVRHGIMGTRSEHKRVPDAVFRLDKKQVGRFLSVLFGCDGYVHTSDRLSHAGYCTISEGLARDVQHLLLRLGIVATIRTLPRKVYEGTGKAAREVRITDQESLFRFLSRVGAAGKGEACTRMFMRLAGVPPRSYGDTHPAEAWDRVVAAKGGRTWRELSLATGRAENHNWHAGKRRLSRHLLEEIAAWAGDESLNELATSDVWWDEIVSIKPLGEQETYDLEVPLHHNFVADDLVVHNSALMLNIAEYAAVQKEKPVALFSLEMSETELAQRFIASEAKLNGDDLRKGRVRQDRWPKVVKATERLASSPLFIDDSSDLGIMELRAKARRLHSRKGLGLIIVDYLQLMRPEDSSQNRVEQIGQISRGLKMLARELKVPVIAVSQLSRAVESRNPPKPMLSDLRESGQIEQDADVVMFIYRDEYYNKDSERPGEADISIAKHRNGPVGEIVLTFLSRYPKFANMYRERDVEGAPPAADGIGV